MSDKTRLEEPTEVPSRVTALYRRQIEAFERDVEERTLDREDAKAHRKHCDKHNDEMRDLFRAQNFFLEHILIELMHSGIHIPLEGK